MSDSVRWNALRRSIKMWAAPFVLQLLGEYVIELVGSVASLLQGPPRDAFVGFLRENPGFLELISQRATSYWDVYYRTQFRKREDYPAFPAIITLRQWLSPERAA